MSVSNPGELWRRQIRRRWGNTSIPAAFIMERPGISLPAPGMLLERHGGKVPGTMEELTALPGVGRKTANLILGDVFGQEGYVCDTHCIRITGRLGITDGSKDPLQVERQLRVSIPPKESSNFCHRMVLFGRGHLHRRSPKCSACPWR